MNQPLANCTVLQNSDILVVGNNMNQDTFNEIVDTADYTDTSLYLLDNQIYITVPYNSPQLLRIGSDAYAVLSYNSTTWTAVRIKSVLSNSLLVLDTSTLAGDITLYTFTGVSYPKYRYVNVINTNGILIIQGETFTSDLVINSNNIIAPFVVAPQGGQNFLVLFS